MTQRILYLDLIGGASGDMLMAALVDAGASLAFIRGQIGLLERPDLTIDLVRTQSAGLAAARIDVRIAGLLGDAIHADVRTHDGHEQDHEHPHEHPHGHPPEDELRPPQNEPSPHVAHQPQPQHRHRHRHRRYVDVRDQLARAPLAPSVRALAERAFAHLGEAEAVAHDVPLDEVILHEVGADDALADVVGVAAALHDLAVDHVIVSPIPLGRGLTMGAHGPIPLPAPATLTILRGVPIVSTTLQGETVTPTGAALLRAMATHFGPMPSMSVSAIGTGAGRRSWPDRPNIVRALLGSADDDDAGRRASEEGAGEDVLVEANIDDMSPELIPDLEAALFEAGAFDVWTTSIHMKKGRMGVMVQALGRRASEAALCSRFFAHSTTLGVRIHDIRRSRAPREVISVETEFGEVAVKIAPRPGPGAARPLVMPEHDDCARLARAAGVPVRLVAEAAIERVRADPRWPIFARASQ
ncbi:MAG: LarC family nickel insertion protein [Deltaproteobacteria bacterium]|nr:LarC family nickel insertion protein [Deltaproteobacteria bacterium]